MNELVKSANKLKRIAIKYRQDTSQIDSIINEYSLIDLDDIRYSNYVEITNTCWLWRGSIQHGYGRFHLNGKSIPAHHYLWSIINGRVRKGMHLDHLCKVKNCVNPYHLEQVTPAVNVYRAHAKSYCSKGHYKGLGKKCTMCKTEYYRQGIKKTLQRRVKSKLESKRLSYTTAKAKGLI